MHGVKDPTALDDSIVLRLLKLPFAPHRFFQLPEEAQFVNAVRLELGRCRPDGVVSANRLMMRAYRGEIAKRAPISVRALGRGRFLVLDGNSSAINCLFSEWSAVPVLAEDDKGRLGRASSREGSGPPKAR